ncbi:hypothetical protein DINM_001933 [Dirofilaria immitis]|nr:hypothetical protein [Dirofilaria immitis]
MLTKHITVSSLYDPQKCGISLNSISNSKRYLRRPYYQLKIMGGTDVEVGEHPWTVAIYLKNSYCCVGTLISNKHVITAAHCFIREDIKPSLGLCHTKHAITEEDALKHIKIMYGSKCLKRSKISNCFNLPPMKTMAIVSTDVFSTKLLRGDIALLELQREIDGKDANYICLATAMKRILMYNLQKLEFHRVLNRDMCGEIFDKLPNDVLCTDEAYNRNICLGDSGGGLMAQLHDGRWLLLGISSYGSPCKRLLERTTQPLVQVYTDVKMYSGEIDKFTGYFLPWEQI